MIPDRLRLHNFMCYRGDATLDLAGIHLACLAGDNGHGKSALLDALTYALWGEARARRDEDLITLGTDEMEVELEFRLGDDRYRILRKRSRRGKTRMGALELQLWDGQRFNAITGASTRETQAQITRTLRMTYDTFINSAFLLQGRADEFARKGPAERKQVLADILGLGMYDTYEEAAKARVKTLDDDALRLGAEIASFQQELRQKPRHEAELARLESEAAQAETRLRGAEAALQQVRDEKRALDQKSAQAAEIEARTAGTRREVAQLEADVAQKQGTLETAARRIADAERIAAGFAQWQVARERDGEFNSLLTRATTLTGERVQLEKRAQAERSQLELEARGLRERLSALDAQIADGDARQAEYGRTRQMLAQLAEKEAQREQTREQHIALSSEVNELTTANKHLRTQMESLKEKLDKLKGAAVCPLCQQPISAEEAARLQGEYLSEGKGAREQYDANNARISQRNFETEQLKAALQRLDQDLRARNATQAHEARLADLMQRAARALADRATVEAPLAAISARLAGGDYAREAQARIAAIDAQLAALGYDAAAHESVRRAVAALAPYEHEHAQMQAARERLDAERQMLALLESTLAAKRQLIAADESALSLLKADTARLDAVARAMADQQRLVNELQGRSAVLNRQLGAARQLVEHARQYETLIVEKQGALAACHAERALYEELRVAFGKKGVQAMLIEAAIPEIEQEANQLLSTMTDGRMSVRFETQREKLTARKDEAAAIETLDIVISDEVGARSYEMFSGGESFRVNFAVRIALSKLLARRAGARLQTLVIDEGFGALDTTGRERLVEAITAVQNQFERILVITHIDELKDLFPARIDVVKTGGGSSIFIN
ncbi:MAG: SMC family ATPase [Chloroflexi bacterium]|nr:SMC family ATPase [Chloroflexota bacterium]